LGYATEGKIQAHVKATALTRNGIRLGKQKSMDTPSSFTSGNLYNKKGGSLSAGLEIAGRKGLR